MPTRKIADLPKYGTDMSIEPCRDPDHNVPTHMVFENGVYEHVCSACGARKQFIVNNPTLGL